MGVTITILLAYIQVCGVIDINLPFFWPSQD